ncbi:hypothetical protein [Streptomyces iranensis]|uniref:Uncharacterized protein n=1 Tax=Streptomyces iranensis TaxID=576784 RepID=A0A060ZLR3_9ACTN|nr:hypothetical protein [Streptomyces iranensis]MBP2063944.1 hypothetical protein [Streptomyces iranensis]CDR06659.1 predicted protein [Streptomyces iranensis]
MSTPTGFKQRLESELSAMATDPAPLRATRAPARRLRVRFAVTAVAAAAATAVVVPTLSGSGASPAYAVTKQGDGSLVLRLDRAEGLPGLQKQLKEMGVRAAVLEGDKKCPTGAPPESPWATEDYAMTFPAQPWKAVIHPDMIPDAAVLPDGRRVGAATLLVVAEFGKDHSTQAVSFRLVEKVPTCSVPGIGGGPDAHM